MRRLILLPLVIVGCFRDADPIDVEATPLQVHAVLRAGTDSATVLISRPATDRFAYLPVSGADVRLSRGGVVEKLDERADGVACAVFGRTPVGSGTGCYTTRLPGPIEAGGVYDLDVVLAGGVRITGRTHVPGGVELTAPEPGTVYTVECPPIEASPACQSFRDIEGIGFELLPLAVLELEWTTPPSADRVDVVFRPTRIVSDGTEYPGDRCEVHPQTIFRPAHAERGALRWPVHSIYCGGPLDVIGWDTIYIEATVSAYDPAYTAYVDAVFERDAARQETVTAGIQGAIGVFGAVNSTVRELALVRVER